MSRHTATAILGLLLLGACGPGAQGAWPGFQPIAAEDLAPEALNAGYQRAVEQSLTEAPFANGALAVFAVEGGEASSYRLVPCQGGRAICGGGPNGPAGRLVRTPDWFAVQGLHGRTFWLGYGGDGYLERNGQLVPLAWEARVIGTGDGDAPSLETPFRHD